jgi:hypothetical protein
MTAFEVSLNGRRFCTAGLTDGVLTAIMTRVNRPQAESQRSRSTSKKVFLSLSVGGLNTATDEHLRWKTRNLKQGDVVTLRVVEVPRVDKPREREARDPRKELRAKQRYVRDTAKELGWTIVEKATPKKKVIKKRAA